MSKNWKRFLSLLLAMTMILSLGVTGFAEDGETEETEPEIEENYEDIPEETILETEPLNPAKLNVPLLGMEEPEEEDEITPMEENLDEIVRVSIFLDKPSTLGAGYPADGVGTNSAAIAYRDGLKSDQERLTAEIERVIGHPLDVCWNITLAANAISANVSLADMVKIEQVPGVKAVERENRYLPMEGDEPNTGNTSENMTGAAAAWANGYTGAGSRIAIVDTGVDTAHQSFAAEPFTYSVGLAGAADELLTQNEVRNLASQLNSKSSNYVSAKIPYGYNYIDNNTTIDHKSDTAGNHGSHVAGIAAANRYIGTAHNDSAATVGAVGMAPDAQLLIMKVFGKGGGAYDSDYFVAIEDAMILGADACNLSLGSAAPGWTFDNTYQDLLNGWTDAHNSKMVLTISAGNSYAAADFTDAKHPYIEDAYTHTGGSPGSFVNSLCVAAAQNTLTKGMPLVFNEQSIFYAESTEGDEGAYTNPKISTVAGTYDLVYIDAKGEPGDYSAVNSALSLSGKVVIVNRGDLSFSEKGNNAKSYNPKALIIANNADGVINMNLADYTGTFPMVSITLKDANKIKAGCTANTAGGVTYYTGRITITNVEQEMLIPRSEATITEFSSWGAPGSLLMKPEITAPGGDIWSVYGTASTGSSTEGGTDQYVSYSGTSMAAPHMAGLTAVLAERFREDDLKSLNTGLSNYSVRAITQSLMMSTATPMAPENAYLSILQQGAGLADVDLATRSNTVVMMDPTRSYLTGLTGAASDGKVKVELGDDAARKGDYEFGFTVYNLTDDDICFNVETEIFTQASDEEFMQAGTAILPAGTSFLWEGDTPVTEGHDVNRDGVTNLDDAQAILDWLSGVNDGSNLDLEAGEMDGDDELTSYDAYLLLGWEGADEETVNTGLVPAHGSRYCSVRITLSPDLKAWLDANYPGGAFLEGFTYLDAVGSTRDGGKYEDAHSIPILGYYGSWTDATMFETTSYTEALYGSEQLPYSGTSDTNYLSLTLNGANVKFSGNPYVVEDSFPADRLAINSGTNMVRIAYNLIRCAGTTGFAVSKLDEEGLVDEVLSSNVTGNEVTGLYYHVNESTWMNTMTKIYSVNKTPGSFGLAEGDLFRVGFYAIPEYYGMLVKENYTAADAGLLDNEGFKTLLESNELGKGAFVGFDFVIDDTAPQIGLPTLSGSTLNVAATDNQALAYVAVMSLDGGTVYAQAVPGVDEYEISLDASDAIANAQGYVAVFAGDYAGNETAVAVKVNDNTHVEKTVYVLTSTLTPGEEYLIVNRNSAGSGYALYYTLNSSQSTATTRALALNVQNGTGDTNNAPYIDSKDAADTSVWTAGSGSTSGTYTFGNNGWYLRRSNSNALTITKDTSRRDWTWDGSSSLLSINSRYLRYSNNTFILSTATSNVYLYQKTVIRYEVDPYAPTGVTITPTELDLYKGDTADLAAKVLPLTATDRSVVWSSSNPNIATVDEFGKVTAVNATTQTSSGSGTTLYQDNVTIRATSASDPTKYAECAVRVTRISKNMNAIVWDEEGEVFFSNFNVSNLPTWNKSNNNPVGVYLSNAYMADSSTLYASTCDLSGADSVIYTVNRSTYALSELGACYITPFGMARCAEGFGTGYCVFGFAKYLVFGNVEPEADDDYGTYSLFPYGLLDLSETAVGDAYVVALCARNVGTSTSAGYFFLDETGKIWQTTQSYSSTNGVTFSSPTLFLDTGLSAGLQYQSLYFDGTFLYWSRQVDNISELIVINQGTKAMYRAGNFGEGVWPAAGLYVNGSAAPASVEDEIMSEPIQLQRVADRAQLLTADVLEHFARYGIDLSFLLPQEIEEEYLPTEDELPLDETPVEESEPTEEPEPAAEPAPIESDGDSAYLGGLNFFRGAVPAINTVDPQTIPEDEYNDEHEGQISIEITEDEDSHNGLFALAYDTEALSFIDYEVNEDISAISVYVDEDKGVITVAYANVADGDPELPITGANSSRGGVSDYILAGESIVTLNFTVSCADTEIEADTLERNDELGLDEISMLTVHGAGHAWSAPTWEWAEDYSTAAATFVCANNEAHTQSMYGVITIETTPATCEETGLTTYTATVELEGQTYTDTQTAEIPATGHAWGAPTWEWAEDYSTAAATFVCANDETHTQTLEADISAEEVDEGILYTAAVTLEGETYTDQQLQRLITVTFDAGAGAVEPASIRVIPGTALGELPVPTREKWVFMGWYLEPAATQYEICQGTEVTAESSFDADTVVYAHWRLPGDVNGDGQVNTADVTLLAKYVKARGQGVEIVPFSGNVDGNADGKVNTSDVTLLAKYVKARGKDVVIY